MKEADSTLQVNKTIRIASLSLDQLFLHIEKMQRDKPYTFFRDFESLDAINLLLEKMYEAICYMNPYGDNRVFIDHVRKLHSYITGGVRHLKIQGCNMENIQQILASVTILELYISGENSKEDQVNPVTFGEKIREQLAQIIQYQLDIKDYPHIKSLLLDINIGLSDLLKELYPNNRVTTAYGHGNHHLF